MKNSKTIALAGLTTALSLILLAFGTYIETFDLSCLFLASLIIMLPLAKQNFKTSILCYLAVSLLSLIFTASVGRFSVTILYVSLFGIYPIALYFEKSKNINTILAYAIKGIWFVGVCFLTYYALKFFVAPNAFIEKYIIYFLIFGGLIIFVLFDFMMKRFQKITDIMVKKLNF